MTTKSPFHFSNFFENTGHFTSLFEKYSYPWEAIPSIVEFIENFRNLDISSEYEEVSDNVFVGKDVVMDNTSRIDGPAIIGHNTIVGHAAYLRAGVLIGANVNVGHATEVKHSIILTDAKLAHLNYIGDSIVGSESNISGGATLANWRFDKQHVVIKDSGGGISTKMEKMGSIMGDGCFIGVNSVINPGTVLAKGSIVFPLVSVKGTHLESTTLK